MKEKSKGLSPKPTTPQKGIDEAVSNVNDISMPKHTSILSNLRQAISRGNSDPLSNEDTSTSVTPSDKLKAPSNESTIHEQRQTTKTVDSVPKENQLDLPISEGIEQGNRIEPSPNKSRQNNSNRNEGQNSYQDKTCKVVNTSDASVDRKTKGNAEIRAPKTSEKPSLKGNKNKESKTKVSIDDKKDTEQLQDTEKDDDARKQESQKTKIKKRSRKRYDSSGPQKPENHDPEPSRIPFRVRVAHFLRFGHLSNSNEKKEAEDLISAKSDESRHRMFRFFGGMRFCAPQK